ncbi:MAG: pyruvate formate-lyase-activating protein [Patescibacteria group bacterium]|nr:pyruvate formate-lyase-activating protein [Patescibacteria group bacterium]
MLKIHSVETFGTHDGPGIRLVIFLQGCNFSCSYCHNPDTISPLGGEKYSAQQIIDLLEGQRPYFSNGGGLTVSGGEPLLQAKELLGLFKKAKKLGFNLALDTNGSLRTAEARELLALADLVIFDLKQIDNKKHQKLTGMGNTSILKNIQERESSGKPYWIRQVLVSGITDDLEDLKKLGLFCAKLQGLERLEILPYHILGVRKYQELGREYKLSGIKATSKKQLVQAKKILDDFCPQVFINQ